MPRRHAKPCQYVSVCARICALILPLFISLGSAINVVALSFYQEFEPLSNCPQNSKQIPNLSEDEKDDVGIGNEKLNVSLNI